MKKSRIAAMAAIVLVLGLGITVFAVSRGKYESMTGWRRTLYAIVNREKILETRYEGGVSEDTWLPEDEYRLEDTVVLMKDPDRDFVIVNIADLHLSDYTQDSVTAIRSFDSVRRMVEEIKPDLITLSGDNVWKDSTIYSMHRITELMDSFGIPWAPVFGNHDYEGNCDLNYLADIMMSGEHCLMQKGDSAMGVGNYIINVCEEREGKTEVVHSLILMDSHGGGVWENQTEWFKWAVNGVKTVKGGFVETTVLCHVPVAQYQDALDAYWDEEMRSWKPGADAFGAKREKPDMATDQDGQNKDFGLFAAMKEVGTKNMLCAHDHVNDFSVVYDGIRLTYSLRLGYGAYFDTDTAGVTTVTIGADGEAAVAHHYRYLQDREKAS